MSVSKQDIITSIKNSEILLKIPELQGAKPRLNTNGSLFTVVGGFNMVFLLEHQTKKWAFRVWHVPMGEHRERYRQISKYLSEKNLPYFADFIYDEKGLLVNGNLLDTIRMEWLEGKLLKEFIKDNLSNKAKLKKLANDFLEMCISLRENKISHGDLQEGNILIDKNSNIKLIDYDSICIPSIEGQKELVTGLKGYQHPSRFKEGKASLKADFFSELVIYTAILALSETPDLWNKYELEAKENFLLFTDIDFENFENSEIYKDLQKLSNYVKSLTRILNSYLKESHYLNLIGLENYLAAPKITYFKANESVILQGKSIELSWNVENVDIIKLNNGIGNVTDKHSLSVSATQATTYKLISENAFGRSEEEIRVEILALPKIKEFRSKHHKIEFGKSTEIIWDIENVEKVELYHSGNIDILPNKGSKLISPADETSYKIIVTALDGLMKEERSTVVQVFKRIEIEKFTSDYTYIIESLPIKLNWKINNASVVKLCSNIDKEIDVTNKNKITLKPKRNQYYYLKAKNDLFTLESEKISIEVQNLPTIPRFENIIPSGKELVPVFILDFSENTNSILTESQKSFQKAVKTNKRFSLIEIFRTIMKK